jgi:uncharacterized membrane protein YecN with MAPEG domain
MAILPVTSALCALSALGLVVLSVPITVRRFRERIPVGFARDQVLHARIRAQANYIEYVPLALLTLGLAEAAGTPRGVLIGCAVALAVGRALHAAGMWRNLSVPLRASGMLLTWGALTASALSLAWRLIG